ncbi:uncharacterized protein F5Z01DRAFT_7253 [Emericellopsis atlantica]|uniref:Uncharacterized protein n=1 Tax=Emericellopsis atlantica TaxID=2614577 RepID=A0A9P8CTI9_9HYPO|nr:uncharacterized protein F5Z01DRAFT_7253 [Emericellopsis atlantica]KAG9258883.1 hypothetical protein F5Z01DRAFT_7253 [Emericellopsis atlantica]
MSQLSTCPPSGWLLLLPALMYVLCLTMPVISRCWPPTDGQQNNLLTCTYFLVNLPAALCAIEQERDHPVVRRTRELVRRMLWASGASNTEGIQYITAARRRGEERPSELAAS